ncbi:DUF2808 domain-containing protein [Leptolyngbya sp. AN02str]|uniref:DUF2808 domain-containing protein n=1 Tax=Leptolyngbya sp. AN02str TaxID=3423363 RepID=UPI003D317FA2
MISKLLATRFLPALAIAACLASSVPVQSLAQGTPGLTIFSGVDRENQLGYRLDFNGRPDRWDRYRLRISRQKMSQPVSEFIITYPENFTGRFDTDRMEILVNNDEVDIDEIVWDREARELKLYPVDAIPANSRVELVFSNVRNPRNGGTYYFNALTRSPSDIPLRRYIGTWVIDIGR